MSSSIIESTSIIKKIKKKDEKSLEKFIKDMENKVKNVINEMHDYSMTEYSFYMVPDIKESDPFSLINYIASGFSNMDNFMVPKYFDYKVDIINAKSLVLFNGKYQNLDDLYENISSDVISSLNGKYNNYGYKFSKGEALEKEIVENEKVNSYYNLKKYDFIEWLTVGGAIGYYSNKQSNPIRGLLFGAVVYLSWGYLSNLLEKIYHPPPINNFPVLTIKVDCEETHYIIEETDIEELQCGICSKNKKTVMLNCGHLYCPECIDKLKTKVCPECKEGFWSKTKVFL